MLQYCKIISCHKVHYCTIVLLLLLKRRRSECVAPADLIQRDDPKGVGGQDTKGMGNMFASLPDPLPNEPASNWMTAYDYMYEGMSEDRSPSELINDCLRAGHGKPEIEYARDMIAIVFGKRTREQIVARRAQAMEQAA